MILSVLGNLVSQMNSNSTTYIFDTGWAEWLNADIDEFDATKGLVLYDSDSPIQLQLTLSGSKPLTFKPQLFFAFKSETEWTPEEHDENCITPALNAARELATRMENDNVNIDSVSITGDGVAIFNNKDVNISGVIFPFEIKLRNNPSICVS